MPLDARIRAHQRALTPQLRVAAQYVSRHPEDVATRSLRAVASAAELTPATLSRLAKALGFENYEQLRELCRETLRGQRQRFADRARALQHGARRGRSSSEFLARQGASTVEQIEALLASLEAGALESTVEQLSRSRYVRVFGALSSRPFAEYLAYMGAMAFENWRALDMAERSMAAGLTGMDRRDALVLISLAPCAQRSVRLAEQAQVQGVHLTAIVDDPLSPVAVRAASVIATPSDGPNFFPSYGAVLTVLEALMGMAVARGGAAAQERIGKVEAASHATGDYWRED